MRKFDVIYQTPFEWVEKVSENFPLFLADHAANERKAAAAAMSLVVQYPDRLSLVATAARIAEEEIGHFRRVFSRMKRLGYPLQPDTKDPYAVYVVKHVRDRSEERLVDRLLVNSIFELRGLEKFELLGKEFPKAEWREFFTELGRGERGHAYAFLKEAQKIFAPETIRKRFDELAEVEAEACLQVPLSYRIH